MTALGCFARPFTTFLLSIFEWEESKPDLAKCLYGDSVPGPAIPEVEGGVAALPFSTVCASQLIKLAKARNLDGYLLNIETDLDFLPPVWCYPGKSKNERDEDAAYLDREKFLVGLGSLLSSDLQQRREQRMEKNATVLASWAGWLREEGKRLISPHWEVIWYDSVTTAGNLQWQDALTGANAPFFSQSDGIFTNYTWARPPDPVPPGGYPKPPKSQFEHHPKLLASAVLAEQLGRSVADVYIGIDVFGRGCYGGYEVGRSLDMIFPYHNSDHEDLDVSGPKTQGMPEDWPNLGFSVALFAPGWTWEREKVGGGERGWEEWWEDDLRFWFGKTIIAETPQAPPYELCGVGRYFGPRQRSLCELSPLLSLSQSESLSLTVKTSAANVGDTLHPTKNSEVSIRGTDNTENLAPRTFYTNFNRSTGHSWWVRGQNVYDASLPAKDPLGRLGWTDIGTSFPKPDRIWPKPIALYLEEGDTKALRFESSQNHWTVQRAALVDFEAWHGGSSLEVLLHSSVPPNAGPGRNEKNGAHTSASSSRAILPLCTLDACYISPQLYGSNACSIEVVVKPLELPAEIHNVHDLQLRPYIIWASSEPGEECSYHNFLLTGSPAESKLVNGWSRITVSVKLDQLDKIQTSLFTLKPVVPVVALGIDFPAGDTNDISFRLRLLVGEMILSPLIIGKEKVRPELVKGLPHNHRLDPHVPVKEPLAGTAHWKSVSPPKGAPLTSLWGILSWGDYAEDTQLRGSEHIKSSRYFNIFASGLSNNLLGNDNMDLSLNVSYSHMWLGTPTSEANANSFVIAGLEPSSLATEGRGNVKEIIFCVHGVGIIADTPEGHNEGTCLYTKRIFL
ncbi:glycoside hydrolase family 85 protein [Ramaria rubella]|nr:glycoside hydrolase family 85 protein [Ramaria rubella]